MTDLRKAAEMALGALENLDVGDSYKTHNAASALRQALAQAEKETLTLDRGCWERGCVAYDERDGDGVNISAERVDETAKCKRKWVGLTDEEVEELAKWADKHAAPWHLEFARAIEAKLKEKNGG
jgi:hypothetical protein